MEQFTYIIVGGGMTADAAVRGIRELDRSGRIAIFSQEEYQPYNRPPLTKGLWTGTHVDKIWRNTAQENVTLYLNKTVSAIDSEKRIVKDNSGSEYSYQKLLLATGGIPNKLDCPNEGVLYYRTLKDYYELRKLYDKGEDFVVIGDGFIGTELAASLAMNGKNITLIFKDKHILEKKLPKNFASFLNAYYTEKEVQLIPSQTIASVARENEKFRVKTNQGREFVVDGVIAGLGIKPNTELANACGVTVDNGITVDEHLQTSQANIWAAGDVANFYTPRLDRRLRVEHEDAANSMGKLAGRNMAGAKECYTYLPYFYSDIFEIGYEAIGEISSDMETVEEWTEPFREGSLYFLRDGKIRGALFVNTWDQIPKAREMLNTEFKTTRL